jgi:hypothetical protein
MMKKFSKSVATLVLMLLAAAGGYASAQAPTSMDLLTQAADHVTIEALIQCRYPSSKASQCFEDRLPAALASAGDAPDLRAAVKEFYVKGTAVAAGLQPAPGETQRAYDQRIAGPEHELDEARARLRMEAKLAHK